ncbi:MAG: AMP-binding protein, partial [Bacteroidetes bacterium]|nr:AMP-binding protein [Bacteroidota bacterium]
MIRSQLKQDRIIDLLPFQLDNAPLEKAFCDKVKGKWRSYSTKEAKEIIDKISLGLINLGVNPGDKLGIISGNRVEWNFVDIGILQIGAVNIPLYPNMSEDNYKYIFEDSGIKIVFVENEELYKKVKNVEKRMEKNLQGIYTFERVENSNNWNEIKEKAEEDDREKLNKLIEHITKDDLATIIYTSGTTGEPKGVKLTHFNIISNVLSLSEIMPHDPFSRTISFLPLCHIFERTAVYFYIYNCCSVHYPESMEKLGENIKEVKPQYFV